MRSVTITLLAKDGFSRTVDVSEDTFRYGIFYIAVKPELSLSETMKMLEGPLQIAPLIRREFVQDRSHLTLFRER
jgi:hypothetical protein